MHKILLVLLSFNLYSNGIFHELWRGYLKSETKALTETKIKLSEVNKDFSMQQNLWSFEVSFNKLSTNLDAPLRFNPFQTQNDVFSWKLEKATFYYGVFSFEQSFNKYDLSDWNSLSLGGADLSNNKELTHKFSYSYDILNNSLKDSARLSELQSNTQIVDERLNDQEQALNLFNAYMLAKINLMKVRLTKKSLGRAQKRFERISKRVKSGASQKIDRYLSLSLVQTQKASLELAQADFEQKLLELENIIGFKAPKKRIAKIYWTVLSPDKEFSEKENLNIESLKAKLDLAKKNLEQISNARKMKLTFNFSYQTNAVEKDWSDSFGDNFNNNYESLAGLNLKIPFGSDFNRSLRLKNKVERLSYEKELSQARSRLKLEKDLNANNTMRTKKALEYSKSQKYIMQKAFKETQRLYDIGRSNFDELIRREEGLINAQLDVYSKMYQLENLKAMKHYLRGNIIEYLQEYRD